MKLSYIAKKMVLIICASLLVLIAAGAVYYRSLDGALSFAIGAVLGAALNILKLVMLEWTVDKVVQMGKERAAGYIRGQQLLRSLLTGVVLVAVVFVPYVSLWGCVAGILTLQVATIAVKFIKDPEQSADKPEEASSEDDGLSEREVN